MNLPPSSTSEVSSLSSSPNTMLPGPPSSASAAVAQFAPLPESDLAVNSFINAIQNEQEIQKLKAYKQNITNKVTTYEKSKDNVKQFFNWLTTTKGGLATCSFLATSILLTVLKPTFVKKPSKDDLEEPPVSFSKLMFWSTISSLLFIAFPLLKKMTHLLFDKLSTLSSSGSSYPSS